MLDQMVVIYCLCDETLKALNFKDDLQCKMTTAEIVTFSLMSAIIFGGDYRKSRLMAMYTEVSSKFGFVASRKLPGLNP